MFEQTFTATQKTRREQTIACALLAQAVLVTGLGLLPLFGIQPLGQVKQMMILPPIQSPPVPDDPHPAVVRSTTTSPRIFQAPSPRVPISEHVAVVNFAPIGEPAPLAMNQSGPIGPSIGLPVGGEIRVAPPVRPPAPKPSQPVRLTSSIAESQLVYGPRPVYPHLALVSRSEGTVKLQAIISREGKIENLHVISGPALLVEAAMNAVRSWRYKPLLLNGEPVEVVTEVEVIFTLQH